MITNVIVNVSIVVPIRHGGGAVQSFLEKLAKDKVVDSLNCAENEISVKKIAAIAKGGVIG